MSGGNILHRVHFAYTLFYSIYFQPMLHTLFMNFVTVHIDLTRSYFQKEVFYLGFKSFFFKFYFVSGTKKMYCLFTSTIMQNYY